jgi:hypothetical protein
LVLPKFEFNAHSLADGCAYAQVFLDTPLQQCIDRDALRPGAARVGEGVIRRMHEQLEAPSPELHAWERHTLVVSPPMHPLSQRPFSPEPAADAFARALADLLARAMRERPVSAAAASADLAQREAERQRSREANARSVLHRAELQAREVVGQAMKRASKRSKTALAKVAQRQKRDRLEQLRGRLLSPSPSESEGAAVLEDDDESLVASFIHALADCLEVERRKLELDESVC